MTIRVRTEFFADVLKEIDRLAIATDSKNIVTEDVSKQFVDLESRLKTKREVEWRYMTILRNKAGTVTELLEAEKNIGQLHEEIEATISRINHLKNRVSYSTIRLEFYQTDAIINAKNDDDPSVWDQFADAFTGGLNGLIIVLVGLANLWPLVLLMAVIVVIYKKKQPSV